MKNGSLGHSLSVFLLYQGGLHGAREVLYFSRKIFFVVQLSFFLGLYNSSNDASDGSCLNHPKCTSPDEVTDVVNFCRLYFRYNLGTIITLAMCLICSYSRPAHEVLSLCAYVIRRKERLVISQFTFWPYKNSVEVQEQNEVDV